MATEKERKAARKKVSKKGVLKYKEVIEKALESNKPKRPSFGSNKPKPKKKKKSKSK
jgi:hypothetical protein